MEVKRSVDETSPSLDSFVAELNLNPNDIPAMSSKTMDRLTIAALATTPSPSPSPSPSPPTVPERSPFRPGHKHGASSPILILAYANRPLPPLPPNSSASTSASTSIGTMKTQRQRRRATTSEGSSLFIDRSRQSVSDASAPRNDFILPLQQQQQLFHNHHLQGHFKAVASPTASVVSRSSYGSSIQASRRSSQKIHQLTGVEVDVMDHQLIDPPTMISDASSTKSNPKTDEFGTPDYHLVPVLETDDDGSSSRGSSWSPMSPEPDAIPAPLSVHRAMADEDTKNMNGLSESFPQLNLDDDIDRHWEPAHGQFGDIGAAGEYHRFTANLASRHTRQVSADSTVPSTTSSKKKRLSLSLALSAATRFSRRRERAESMETSSSSTRSVSTHKDSSKPPGQPTTEFIAGPAYSAYSTSTTPRHPADVAPPRPPPAPPLRSAWDSDSDNDEAPALPTLKEWFAQRTSEENKGHRRISSGSRFNSDRQTQVPAPADRRESLIREKDRAKQIKMEKAAKRREERRAEFKKSFAIIPEEFAFAQPRYL